MSRNNRMRRNMSLAVKNESCPYCSSHRIWAAKTNVKASCTKCKKTINHKLIFVENKYDKLRSKIVAI